MTMNYDRFELFGKTKDLTAAEKKAKRKNPNIGKRRARDYEKPGACIVITGDAAQRFL